MKEKDSLKTKGPPPPPFLMISLLSPQGCGESWGLPAVAALSQPLLPGNEGEEPRGKSPQEPRGEQAFHSLSPAGLIASLLCENQLYFDNLFFRGRLRKHAPPARRELVPPGKEAPRVPLSVPGGALGSGEPAQSAEEGLKAISLLATWYFSS